MDVMKLHSFLENAIERGSPNPNLKKAVEDARFQRAVYTGKDQEYILDKYRINETDGQKKQRKRITLTKTKHTLRQVDNVLDQLQVMDQPAIKVINKNQDIADDLSDYIYEECLDQLAFDLVKYYNMTDANAFVVCGVNEEDEIEYRVLDVDSLYDYKVINKKLKYVVFISERKVKKENVHDYYLYHNDGIITYENTKGKESFESLKTIGKETYNVIEVPTQMIYAFRLGFKEDMTNKQQTTVSLIDSASELLTSLIWEGSELDTTNANHGIVQKREYASKCGYSSKTSTHSVHCSSGFLISNGAPTGDKCPKCVGGLVTHTSGQDILLYPMPSDPKDIVDLSKLSHTTFIPTHILDYKKETIKELKEEIVKTIFNSSMVTKDEINKTATKVMVDLTGIYATLNQIGNQVSECFIWMVRCASFIRHGVDSDVIHGYTLNLKLEDVFSLAQKLKALQESNAPIVLIKAVEMAMIQKQHLSSPVFIARYSIWESLKPFSGKTKEDIQLILTSVPDTFRPKVLYNFFGDIRNKIDAMPNSDKLFYEASPENRQKLIDAEIDLIIESLEETKIDRIDMSNI